MLGAVDTGKVLWCLGCVVFLVKLDMDSKHGVSWCKNMGGG